MRGGKSLVQIDVDAIESHVAGTRDTHYSVQICAVVVAKTARGMNNFGYLCYIPVKYA